MLSDQGRKLMSYVTNWENEIRTIAGPFRPHDTKESWLGRAYKEVCRLNPELTRRLTFRHFTSLFYGRVADPKYSVAASVLSAADQARIEEARINVGKVAQLYRVHAERLAAIDPDFHSEQINALLCAARILGERDSAGNSGGVK